MVGSRLSDNEPAHDWCCLPTGHARVHSRMEPPQHASPVPPEASMDTLGPRPPRPPPRPPSRPPRPEGQAQPWGGQVAVSRQVIVGKSGVNSKECASTAE